MLQVDVSSRNESEVASGSWMFSRSVPVLSTLGLRSVSNWPGLFWGAMVTVSGHTLAEVLSRWCPVCVSHTPCPVLSGGRMH